MAHTRVRVRVRGICVLFDFQLGNPCFCCLDELVVGYITIKKKLDLGKVLTAIEAGAAIKTHTPTSFFKRRSTNVICKRKWNDMEPRWIDLIAIRVNVLFLEGWVANVNGLKAPPFLTVIGVAYLWNEITEHGRSIAPHENKS